VCDISVAILESGKLGRTGYLLSNFAANWRKNDT
jgi:hypothetical protein